jgi:hypothetical protein
MKPIGLGLVYLFVQPVLAVPKWRREMNKLNRCLIAIPVCMCLSMPVVGAVNFNAPTINDVNQALQQNDFAEMERLCREILAEDSDHAQAIFMLGYALHAQGELDEAVLYHIRSTSNPETAPLGYYNLGCAMALKGNADQAFKALNKAVELGIGNPQQYKGDSDLTSLHSDARWEKLIGSIEPNLTSSSSASASASKGDGSDSAEKASGMTPKGLHFWVGEWDCYSAKNGKLMGRNTLAFRVNKHVIHEQWKSEGAPYMGESWNHFDPIKKVWRQTWVGSGGDVTRFAADAETDVDGVMFVGKSFNPQQDGEKSLHKMHVRPIADGMVRQTGSTSKDDGATWTVSYDLIYVKKGTDFKLEDLSI